MISNLTDACDFLADFHRWRKVEPTISKDEIRKGLPLPLETLFLKLGGLIRLDEDTANPYSPPFGTQDSLIEPPGPESGALVFNLAFENQDCFSWRVEIQNGDSQVFCNAPAVFEEDDDDEFTEIDDLESFLITFSLSEAVMSSATLLCWGSSLELKNNPNLKSIWSNKNYYDNTNSRSFYLNEGRDILIMESESGVWLGTFEGDPRPIFDPSVLSKVGVVQPNTWNLTKQISMQTNEIVERYLQSDRLSAAGEVMNAENVSFGIALGCVDSAVQEFEHS